MRISIIFLSLILSACTMMAPPYQASVQNTQSLKHAGIKPLAVGTIEDDKKVNDLSLRGSSLKSPFAESYGKYIENALKSELTQAKLYSEISDIEIRGKLITNDVDVSGFSVGNGEISVEFTVSNNGQVVFQKLIEIKHEWESSFMGGIAIPNGANNYPVMLQMLISKLISDPEFLSVLKV